MLEEQYNSLWSIDIKSKGGCLNFVIEIIGELINCHGNIPVIQYNNFRRTDIYRL